MSIEVFVPGIPRPQGSKRHVGNGRMLESSRHLAPWRQTITATLRANVRSVTPIFPAGIPVDVGLVFTVPAPKSLPSWPVWPAKRPDLDKLIRAVCDGISDAGVWHDDSQAVHISAAKTYPQHELTAHVLADAAPGVLITLTEYFGQW